MFKIEIERPATAIQAILLNFVLMELSCSAWLIAALMPGNVETQ